MTEWIEITLEKLANFFKKHSLLFQDNSRSINKDALIKTAELYALVSEMKEREEFSFIEEEFLYLILKRIEWVFRQLIIDYRINYKNYLEFETEYNRFLTIEPTGEVKVNQRIYNIPKYLKDIGMYPSIAEGTWIKEIAYER